MTDISFFFVPLHPVWLPSGIKRERCETHRQSRCCKLLETQFRQSHCTAPQPRGKAETAKEQVRRPAKSEE